MSPTRPHDDALAWRLVAEAADRLADEAFALSDDHKPLSEPEWFERSTRAKGLCLLTGDLIPS